MQLEALLTKIVETPTLHAKWLNTLSYLENCGARKIARCEHPTLVKEEMLKHAAEEFRHAHYLKRQIIRVTPLTFADYSLPNLLGGTASLHYLSKLDLQTSRYLLQTHAKEEMRASAYLLVTYAIELRAEELYPIYDAILRKSNSKVAVKSILLEEKEHLNEMRQGLSKLSQGEEHAKIICTLEDGLFHRWLSQLTLDILSS